LRSQSHNSGSATIEQPVFLLEIIARMMWDSPLSDFTSYPFEIYPASVQFVRFGASASGRFNKKDQ
jgi:hypothetical protein